MEGELQQQMDGGFGDVSKLVSDKNPSVSLLCGKASDEATNEAAAWQSKVE